MMAILTKGYELYKLLKNIDTNKKVKAFVVSGLYPDSIICNNERYNVVDVECGKNGSVEIMNPNDIPKILNESRESNTVFGVMVEDNMYYIQGCLANSDYRFNEFVSRKGLDFIKMAVYLYDEDGNRIRPVSAHIDEALFDRYGHADVQPGASNTYDMSVDGYSIGYKGSFLYDHNIYYTYRLDISSDGKVLKFSARFSSDYDIKFKLRLVEEITNCEYNNHLITSLIDSPVVDVDIRAHSSQLVVISSDDIRTQEDGPFRSNDEKDEEGSEEENKDDNDPYKEIGPFCSGHIGEISNLPRVISGIGRNYKPSLFVRYGVDTYEQLEISFEIEEYYDSSFNILGEHCKGDSTNRWNFGVINRFASTPIIEKDRILTTLFNFSGVSFYEALSNILRATTWIEGKIRLEGKNLVTCSAYLTLKLSNDGECDIKGTAKVISPIKFSNMTEKEKELGEVNIPLLIPAGKTATIKL